MKKNVKIIIALAVAIMVGIGAVLAITHKPKDNKKLSIVTTNFPAYDFARAVAGDKADIKMLIQPGAELHSFEPSPNDIIDIKNSDLFIYTGGESDEWVEDILTSSNDKQIRSFKLMSAVELLEEEEIEGMEEHEHEHEHEHSDTDSDEHHHEHEEGEVEYDEHVWTSLRNSQKIISGLAKELGEISSENKDHFEANADSYNQKLAKLDSEFQSIVDSAKRKTLVFGDRFPLRYFVEDYGLEYFAAFPGCSEQTEASNKTIAFLIDKVKSENIPVVLKIEMSSANIAETITKETNTKYLTFNSAHNISADDFKNGKTYADIMESNLEVIREALN